MKVLVTQQCLTLCNPMDCSLSGSFIPWNSLFKNTRGVALPFSRGSSRPRDRTQSCSADKFFTIWDTRSRLQSKFSKKWCTEQDISNPLNVFLILYNTKQILFLWPTHLCISLTHISIVNFFYFLGECARTKTVWHSINICLITGKNERNRGMCNSLYDFRNLTIKLKNK